MRIARSSTLESDWESVSPLHPCPVCSARTGCRLHADAPFACCESEPSEWPLTNGSWLHRLQAHAFALLEPAGGVDAFSPHLPVAGSRT